METSCCYCGRPAHVRVRGSAACVICADAVRRFLLGPIEGGGPLVVDRRLERIATRATGVR